MALPERRKRKGNPHPKPPSRRKQKKSAIVPSPTTPPPYQVTLLPQDLEHFCWAIFAGKSARIAAAEIGRKPNSGFYLRHLPAVQQRYREITKQYQEKILELKVNERALTVDFLDEQIIDIAANGESGDGAGRNAAVIAGYKSLMMIDAPSPQTIVALQMQAGGAKQTTTPKLYEARRFLQLRQADTAPVPNA